VSLPVVLPPARPFSLSVFELLNSVSAVIFVSLLLCFSISGFGRPQDRKNDRKTTGFTKPLRPELNFGKEKVKFW
jgi:hypothetical protein